MTCYEKPDTGSLRRHLRSLRNGLSPRQRASMDNSIRQQVLELVNLEAATSLAVFWPFDGEPDIIPLCRILMANGVDIGLPVVSNKRGHHMAFHAWNADTRLAPNRYGIPEPQCTDAKPVAGFDILFIPLVAYDRRGNRLGMGSGYYDRHLESLVDTRAPLRMGVAYGIQEAARLSSNDWDIPLHGVVNENGWFMFGEDTVRPSELYT